MEKLDINGKMFEKLLADMDAAVNIALREMIDKQICTGSVNVKIGINAEPMYDDNGKRYINPKIKFATGISLKSGGKLESSAPRGYYLGVDENGSLTIAAEQISIDDMLHKKAG